MAYEYLTPIIGTERSGDGNDPYIEVTNDIKKVVNGKVKLNEVPFYNDHVYVTAVASPYETEVYYETFDYTTEIGRYNYRVDYNNGNIYFNPECNGRILTFKYRAKGFTSISVERVFVEENGGEVVSTLGDIIDLGKSFIDNLQHLDTAIIEAETATTNAIVATNNANTAISNTQSATLDANNAATLANEKATLADTNAQLANTAATNANIINSNITTAENLRVTAEQSRVDAEETRVLNENARIARDAEFVNKGTYSNETAYKAGNEVLYVRSSYRAKIDTQGNPPPAYPTNENTWWILTASQGSDGTGGDMYKADFANNAKVNEGYVDKAILADNSTTLTGLTSNVTDIDNTVTKVSGISTGATKVESSLTNGNIKVDSVETEVYSHPTTHEANMITITDIGGLYDSTDVEGALQESANQIDILSNNLNTLDTNFDSHSSDISKHKLNIKDFGAKGDGVTDDSIAIQTAINASAGLKLYCPKGNYIAKGLIGISNIVIEGEGKDLVTFTRIASASDTTSILEFNSKSHFTISGITFDGNKANETNGAMAITIIGCSDYNITKCKVINCKTNSGYGSGIYISGGTNKTATTISNILNNSFESNDGDGISVCKEWNLLIQGNIFKYNSGCGVNVLDNEYPVVSNVSNNIQILNNFAFNNSSVGIRVAGFVEGGTADAPVLGTSLPQSRKIHIHGNICTNNGSYGIVYQGTNGSVMGNTCELNSRNVDYAGGILFNAANSICSSNSTRDNKSYGIDAGGALGCVISNNECMYEGATDGTKATYINVGAGISCIVSGNQIYMGGSQQCTGISYSGVDGSVNTPFPNIGSYMIITSNSINCNGNASTIGIYGGRLAGNSKVTNNTIINISDVNRAIIIEVTGVIIKNNDVFASAYYGSAIPYVASASTMIIPDGAETMFVTGTTNITRLLTYSQNIYDSSVRDVQINNQGSGYSYTTPPTVAFSGGGGTGAAGVAEVDYSGKVIAVKMTNVGTGYTSAPTVAFSGGGGTGATGTALIGCNNCEGKEISLMFQSALTVTDGNNLMLNGNLVATDGTILKLRGAYGNWYEVSRTIG
jgi:hypothetical protein